MSFEEPKDVSDAEVVFPANVVGSLLPLESELPEEYRRHWHSDRLRGCRVANGLFYRGGKLPPFKQGIDGRKATRHLQACLGSFQPSHEHKIAGVGWLIDRWCEPEAVPT